MIFESEVSPEYVENFLKLYELADYVEYADDSLSFYAGFNIYDIDENDDTYVYDSYEVEVLITFVGKETPKPIKYRDIALIEISPKVYLSEYGEIYIAKKNSFIYLEPENDILRYSNDYSTYIGVEAKAYGIEIETSEPLSAFILNKAIGGVIISEDGSIDGLELKTNKLSIILKLMEIIKEYKLDKYIVSTHIHTSNPLFIKAYLSGELLDYAKDVIKKLFYFCPTIENFFGRGFNSYATAGCTLYTRDRYAALTLPVIAEVNELYSDIPKYTKLLSERLTVEFRLPRCTSKEQFLSVLMWLNLLFIGTLFKKYNKDSNIWKEICHILSKPKSDEIFKLFTNVSKEILEYVDDGIGICLSDGNFTEIEQGLEQHINYLNSLIKDNIPNVQEKVQVV